MSRFFICTDYRTDRVIIIAVDCIEAIFQKTKDEYIKEWENYEVPEEAWKNLEDVCTAIKIKNNSGTYHIKNDIKEIVEFLSGEQNEQSNKKN